MHDKGGGRRGGLFEEGVKRSFPSRTGHCVGGVEDDAGVEVVENFVDLLDLILGRGYVPDVGEGYWRRQRHALRLASLPDGQES